MRVGCLRHHGLPSGGAAAKAECARPRAQQRRRAHDGANHRDSACARTLLRPGRPSKRLSLSAIEKHRLRIGTAYSFQGDERDIMFLSFAIGREVHPGTLRYLDRPDVFNVSITRARNLQVVFCSFKPDELPGQGLRRRDVESIGQPVTADASRAPADAFLHEVETALAARAFHTWPCYIVAGLPVDLLVAKRDRSLGIDRVGYPGRLANAFDLEKYRLFQRAGLRRFPLSFSAWQKQRQSCLEAIDRWLGGAADCGGTPVP